MTTNTPTLRFTPYAWAKLLYLRDRGNTEIGGFGITGEDLLLVEDLVLVKQVCTTVSVEFDDEAVADFFEDQYDQGREPAQVGRIWVHTHPGNSPHPSGTDERTFVNCFGRADWSVMYILAAGGAEYARLRMGANPKLVVQLQTDIEFVGSFPGTDKAAWDAEYKRCVSEPPRLLPGHYAGPGGIRPKATQAPPPVQAPAAVRGPAVLEELIEEAGLLQLQEFDELAPTQQEQVIRNCLANGLTADFFLDLGWAIEEYQKLLHAEQLGDYGMLDEFYERDLDPFDKEDRRR